MSRGSGGAGAVTGVRGMALLTILWALSLLSLIAVVLLSSTLASRRDTHAVLQQARSEALGEAGLNLAVLGLLDPDPNERWRVDGVPREVTFDGEILRIAITDEYGRIDINAADSPTLRRIFAWAGLPAGEADSLTDKVLDWRDADTMQQPNGAEADDYRTAGIAHVPRDAPFRTTDEINLVMGMTETTYEMVAPLLTVYSHKAMINPYTASPSVREALSDSVQAASAAQAGGGAITNGVVASGISLVNWPLRVRVDVMNGEAVVASMETVIRLTNEPHRPVLVQWYEELPVAERASGQTLRPE
jgi:general secretion pathway protein K